MGKIYVSNFLKENIKNPLQEAINNSIKGDIIVVDENIQIGMTILKSNITIHINKGITLKASNDISDFNYKDSTELTLVSQPTWEDCSYDGAPTKFFLYGNSITNFRIEGSGVIDGNEQIFYGRVTKHHIEGKFYPRVPLLYLINSKNISIKNITIRNSAFWTIHLVGDKNVLIDGINIKNSRIFANCDGVDIDSSVNVTVRNSYISCADDCIVLKSTKEGEKYGSCNKIRGYNNTLESTSAAIKIGSESEADFYDIYFYNNKIQKSNRGISFQLRDKGNIYNCKFKNIYIETRHFSPVEWWGKAEPIFLSCVKRYNDTKVGNIRDIKFEDIVIDSENSIYLYGDISNVSFKDISFKLRKKTDYELKIHDLRPSEEFNKPFNTKLTLFYFDGGISNVDVSGFNYSISKNIKNYLDSIYFINGDNINIK